MNHPLRTIAVFGGYRPKPGDPDYTRAETLGRLIAESGWTLINGGYSGTMEAGARGAKAAGGRVIGITCASFHAAPNAFSDEIFSTSDLWARIRELLERSDAFIALPGSTGTLAEVGMAWEMVYKKLIPPRPIVLLTDFWRPLYDMMVTPGDTRAACGGLISIQPTPEAAMAELRARFG